MPELPEVETVVRQLQQKILLKTISHLKSYDSLVIDPKLTKLKNIRITNISRRAKYILLSLQNTQSILIHLRMTGHFHFVSKNDSSQAYRKYCVAKIHFTDGSLLSYNAIRRFERMQLLSSTQLREKLSSLGPEPLDPSYTADIFTRHIRKSPNALIKNKLLDQTLIAGIGNIYAQEALYHASILPQSQIKTVSTKSLKQLHTQLRLILTKSIQNGGTTVNNYTHLDGKGDFQDLLAVYQKDFCPKQHPITRLALAGRGTYYCPICQK